MALTIRSCVCILFVACMSGSVCRSDDVIIQSDTIVGGGVIVPRPDDIATMQASVYNSPLKLNNIDSFDVPSKHFHRVMSMFLESARDAQPGRVVRELGTIRIETKDGTVRHITWMWTGGKTPLKSTLLGVRCSRDRDVWNGEDDALRLELTIRDIYRDKTGIDTFTPSSTKHK